jgi:hypothetical protein
MAKLLQIKLSPKEKLSDVQKSINDPTKLSIREVEITILETLFTIAANSQKELKKMNECYDLIGQVKNLTDDKLEMNLTKADIEYLEKAIETSATQRPGSWFAAREMFKSIEKPVEVEK